MKCSKIFILALSCISAFSQQYDSVKIETENIDSNNLIYKTGNVYIFDYEIIENGKPLKLKSNERKGFELADVNDPSIQVKEIHLIIKPQIDSLKTSENQTAISYYQSPEFSSVSSTGLVENKNNIWLHPIRDGFFRSLETCPFPYVKLPLKKNKTWKDKMLIGENWGNEQWGKWKGDLLLNYNYKIVGRKTISTALGKIDCHVVESTAESSFGKTKLVSYFSEQYGFIRYEYTLFNGTQVIIWLIDRMENKEFNNSTYFFMTKKYLKN